MVMLTIVVSFLNHLVEVNQVIANNVELIGTLGVEYKAFMLQSVDFVPFKLEWL